MRKRADCRRTATGPERSLAEMAAPCGGGTSALRKTLVDKSADAAPRRLELASDAPHRHAMRGVVGDKAGKRDAAATPKTRCSARPIRAAIAARCPAFRPTRRAFLRTTADRKAFPTARALRGGMDRSLPDGDTRRLPDLGIALKSILAFWLLYMALITVRAIVAPIPRFLGDAGAARASRPWSAALTFLIYLGDAAGRPQEPRRQGDPRRLPLPAGLDPVLGASTISIFYVYAPLEPRATMEHAGTMGWSPLEMAGARSSKARSPGISCSPPGRPSTSR